MQKSSDAYIWFTWKEAKNAIDYDIEIASDPEFNNIIFTKKLKTNKYLYKASEKFDEIYWRVKASNERMYSNWTPVRKLNIVTSKGSMEDIE